jgi:hypothetical protein
MGCRWKGRPSIATSLACEHHEDQRDNHKDCGLGWVLLNAIHALKKKKIID